MSLVLDILKRFFTDRFHDQSAQIAYFLMLSIFPFLIFVLSLLSFFPIYSTDVLSVIEPFAPKGSYALIENNVIQIFDKQRTKLVSFSLVASFWISSMAVQSLVRAMNDAYNIIRKEGFFLALAKDLFLTAILMITLTISLLVPIGEEIGRNILLSSQMDMSSLFHKSWFLIKWVVGTMYLFFFFLLLYRFVPSGNIPFSSVLPGAIFSTVGWQAASIGFSYYVSYINYSQLYGQLGSIIVLMLWFYLTAAVLLIGGLINASFLNNN